MIDQLTFRVATTADSDAVSQAVVDAFEGYRDIAPEGWQPPEPLLQFTIIRERIGRPDVWCLMAEQDGELAGHVAVLPAKLAFKPGNDPRLGHFWHLFVAPPWWGSGLAGRLHSAAMEEAASRDWTSIRLFTPADQGRARSFYEREGWTAVGEPFTDELGLPLVEYRRPLA